MNDKTRSSDMAQPGALMFNHDDSGSALSCTNSVINKLYQDIAQ